MRACAAKAKKYVTFGPLLLHPLGNEKEEDGAAAAASPLHTHKTTHAHTSAAKRLSAFFFFKKPALSLSAAHQQRLIEKATQKIMLRSVGGLVSGVGVGGGCALFAKRSAATVSSPHKKKKEDSAVLEEEFGCVETGKEGTLSYQMHIVRRRDGRRISPWHGIPLRPSVTQQQRRPAADDAVIHMVCEMPRGTTAKMEISKTAHGNPIVPDRTRHGHPRHVLHGPLLHNYGSVPQTWADPDDGDDDPVDVIDIGPTARRGQVKRVRVLGALALIDGGERDWKIIAADADDPGCAALRCVADVERTRPGQVDAIREWYRVYKVAEGKQPNTYAFGGKALGWRPAMGVLEDSHASWKDLVSKRGKAARHAARFSILL